MRRYRWLSQVVSVRRLLALSLIAGSLFGMPRVVRADQPVVPGSGTKLDKVGDDFEDAKWSFNHNFPKSSDENDHNERNPGGFSSNNRWAEGLLRGQPDVLKRVPTPPAGIPGSEGSMLMRSLHTGVPEVFSGETHQDDLLARVDSRLGGSISPSRTPSFVTRVFLPPWDKWERREGNSFCFRLACSTTTTKTKPGSGGFGRFLRGNTTVTEAEPYWPGMLIYFHPGNGKDKNGKDKPDSASLRIRADRMGHDFKATDIKETGWWTLGMSVTPDGEVHYYAHAGVEDLTEKDFLSSQYPYSYRAERVKTFFYDVLNGDNGKWSTTWIVDDPSVYVLN